MGLDSQNLPWTMNRGQRTMYNGQQIMNKGQWTTEDGQQTMDKEIMDNA